VGGPATCQLQYLPDFLAAATANGAPVDMITSHLYPTDPNVTVSRTGFTDAVAKAAAVAASASIPLVITEFNSGLGLPNGQDSEFAAAFVAHTAVAIQTIPNLDVLSFWAFTDIFEEGGQASQEYTGNYGIQTIDGIPKPVYRSFQLLRKLYNDAVLVATSGTVDAVVTVETTSTGVSVLLVNYNWFSLPVVDESVTVALSGFGNCTLPTSGSLFRVDANHTATQPAWMAMGSPVYPTPLQIATLKSLSQLQSAALPLTPSAGGVSFTVDMPPHSVAVVTLNNCGL